MDYEAVLPPYGHLCFKNISATVQNLIGQGPDTGGRKGACLRPYDGEHKLPP